MLSLQNRIEAWYEETTETAPQEFVELFPLFLDQLNQGIIRAAEPNGSDWVVNAWVKKGILLGFRWGRLCEYPAAPAWTFFDKDTYPMRPLSLDDQVRLVPGGSSARSGCYLAPGVVIMPPAFINIGAYVGHGSMIDSHALIGSCAQIGRRVHVSAAAQIGGVLEPVGASPVIIEDEVLVGGNCGVYEGTRVRRGAVLGAGTILTRSIPVYDLIHEQVLRGSRTEPLVIPENAVVVAGSRPIHSNPFAAREQLFLYCALIIKYRDAGTDQATALESVLR